MNNMIEDWIFSDEQKVCHFRVAGILIQDNKLLIQKDKDNVIAVPGGHISFGETSENALIREFKEEIGVEISVNRLIWIEENFWKWGKRDAHNISFYYLIALKNDADISSTFVKPIKDNSNILLSWITFDDMKNATIYPEFIKEKIENISDSIEHFTGSSW